VAQGSWLVRIRVGKG